MKIVLIEDKIPVGVNEMVVKNGHNLCQQEQVEES